MADETTTTSTAQDTGTALDGQTSATNANATTAQQSPTDKLVELEKELQRMKSQQGREAAELRRQAQEAQQRAQMIEAQMHQAVTSNMDELQQAKYWAEFNGRKAQELQAKLESAELERIKFQRVTALSQKTGVPVEVLYEAPTPDDLAEIVANYKAQQAEQRIDQEVKTRTAKKEANSVDLGGGGKKRDPSSIDERIKAARASGSVLELAKLRFQLQQQEQ